MKRCPLLTLAIPTYNRAGILNQTLFEIIADSAFSDKIEIVVSDNCSEDSTESVVRKYQMEYPDSIIYHRNNENIHDRNFLKAMSLGTGAYVKLMNDTARFKSGALAYLLSLIEKHLVDKTDFVVYSNTIFHKNVCCKGNGVNQFVKLVSFHTTWIGNFGMWRNTYEVLSDKSRFVDLRLSQLDIMLKLISDNKPYVIYFKSMFNIVPALKGGYNVFSVFCLNYLYILNKYKERGITWRTIYMEKLKIYLLFIYPRLILTLSKDDSFSLFKSENALRIVFSQYKWHLYFYLSLIMCPFPKLIKKIYKL